MSAPEKINNSYPAFTKTCGVHGQDPLKMMAFVRIETDGEPFVSSFEYRTNDEQAIFDWTVKLTNDILNRFGHDLGMEDCHKPKNEFKKFN